MTSHRIETLAEGVRLIPGDCLDVLKSLDANGVDACVTDPPYHLTSMVQRLSRTSGADVEKNFTKTIEGQATNPFASAARGFMGKAWDGGDIAFRPEIWAQVLRVLKPGAHLLAFGGTRTYHRMACAIEDAGFEIRDSIQWLYGSGFPKSLDVSKAIDKAAGAGRDKVRVDASLLNNPPNLVGGAVKGDDRPWRLEAIERGYHEKDGPVPATAAAAAWDGFGTALKPACEPIVLARKPLSESTVAANVLKWGTGALNIDGCRVEAGDDHAANCDRDAVKSHWGNANGNASVRASSLGRWPANIIHDGSDEVVGAFPETETNAGTARSVHRAGMFGVETQEGRTLSNGDSGRACRFFYQAKADPNDRLGSKHPTVKPVDLIQYLVRLVTPPKGLVIDPFAGTGTCGEACIREGMRAILIERESEYCDDIRRRMKLAMCGPAEREREAIKARMKDRPVDAGPLFAGSDTPPRIGRQIYGIFADEPSGQRD